MDTSWFTNPFLMAVVGVLLCGAVDMTMRHATTYPTSLPDWIGKRFMRLALLMTLAAKHYDMMLADYRVQKRRLNQRGLTALRNSLMEEGFADTTVHVTSQGRQDKQDPAAVEPRAERGDRRQGRGASAGGH